MKSFVIFLFVFFTALHPALSQEKEKNVFVLSDSLPFNPAIKYGTLSNGMKYYLARNVNTPGKLLVNFYLKAGSCQEDKDQSEAAHFVEHLVIRRSQHFSEPGSFWDYLSKAGVTATNASTGVDVTSYFFEISTDTAVLHRLFRTIGDWLTGQAILQDKDIDATKYIIAEEAKGGDGYSLINRRYDMRLFEPSRISEIIMRSIQLNRQYSQLSNDAVRRFYRDWYRPDLAALVIVGDIDVKVMEQQVQYMFAGITNPLHERSFIDYPITLTNKNRYIAETYIHPQKRNQCIEVIYKQEYHPLVSYADYKQEMIKNVFNEMMRNRLKDIYRKNQKVYSSIENKADKVRLGSLRLKILGQGGDNMELSFKILFTEIERIKRFGFSAKEIESALSRLLDDSLNYRGVNYYGESEIYRNHFLYHEAALSYQLKEQLRLKFLHEITPKEINSLAIVWLKDENRDIALLAPEEVKSTIPNEKTVMRWWEEVRQGVIEKYTPTEKRKLKVNFDSLYVLPAPAAYSRQDREMGITQLQLANGVRVVLKSGISSSDSYVQVLASRPVGLSRYTKSANYISAKLAKTLLLSSGLGELNQEELEEYNKLHGLNTFLMMGEAESELTGSASAAALELLFQELYRYFLAPRYDSATFCEKLNHIKLYANSYKTAMEKELLPLLAGYHVSSIESSPQELDQVDYALVAEGYAECFSSPSEFTFVITGVQDMESTIMLVAKYLGNLPSQKVSISLPPVATVALNGPVSKTYVNQSFPKDKANVWLYYVSPEVTTIKEAYSLNILMIILDYLTYRRLREKEGAIYYYNVADRKINARQGHNQYINTISFGCQPGNRERLVHAALEEIGQLQKKGPAGDDFKAACSSLQQFLKGRWPSYLLSLYQQPQLPATIEDLEVLFKTIAPQDIQQAAQKYLNENDLIRCYEMPDNK